MSKEAQNQKDYQNSVYDVDELDILENKINPQFYIHNCIINIQNAYNDVDIKTGIMRFMLGVKMLESVVKAKGVSQKYEDELKKIEEEAQNQKGTIADISNVDFYRQEHKFKLLLEEIFSNTKKWGSLKN